MHTDPFAPGGRPSLLRRAALGLLRTFGWKTVLVWPPGPKGVIVVYPHTSNWDFPIGVLFRVGHRMKANWVGKAEMFRPPFRRLLIAIGGIPVDRRRTVGFIDAVLEQFRLRDWMWLAIAPEGTRAHTDHWKAGFYQIALAADVPMALAYIDYATRTVGIDTYIRASGDRDADQSLAIPLVRRLVRHGASLQRARIRPYSPPVTSRALLPVVGAG